MTIDAALRRFLSVLATVLILFSAAMTAGAEPLAADVIANLKSNPKLHAADNILRAFANGASTTRVIVLLQTPPAAQLLADQARATAKVPAEFNRAGAPTFYNLADDATKGQLRSAVSDAVNGFLNQNNAPGLTVSHKFSYQFGFAAKATLEALQRLISLPEVLAVEEDAVLEAHLAQGLPLMKATIPRSTYSGTGVSIAICDTGIDTSHPELGGGGFPNAKVIGGFDTGDNDSDPRPDSIAGEAHGTACAGIAAGYATTTGDYVGGVAPAAKLYALKISSGTTASALNSAMIAAWEWAVTHKNDDPNNPILIISTSFGGGRYFSTCDTASSALTTAAANAVVAGITIFTSAGNDGYCDSLASPACISYVNSVGAVYDSNFGTYLPCVNSASCAVKTASALCSTGYYTTDATLPDKVTSYSNSAPFLTLFAPANQAYTLDIVGPGGYSAGNYDTTFGGTSAACPYAAGAAAVLQQAAKAKTGAFLTPAEVRSYLANNGDGVADSKVAVTKPRINLGAAVNAIVAAAFPNLAPHRPAGWSDKIVVTTTTGTYIDSSVLTTGDALYVDWAAINNGTATASAFSTTLYVDGVSRGTWPSSGLGFGGYSYIYYPDYAIGALTAGPHTVKLTVDSGNAVTESNETDNSYTKTITVVAGYTVSGTVRSGSTTGPGLPNATVTIAGGGITKTAISSSTGTFSVTGIPAGVYTLSITESGYTSYTNASFIVGANQSGLSFSLTRLFYSMSGTVHSGSSTGPVLSGATVTIVGGGTTRTAITSSTGTFTITGIPAGTCSLSISKSGYTTFTIAPFAAVGNQTGLSFSLQPMIYSISGTVHSGSSTGPVVSGATVTIAVAGTTKTAVTSGTGTFSIAGIPAGAYSLSIAKAGYLTYTNASYSVAGNQSSLNFALTPIFYSMSGTVHAGTSTGPALAGATVTLVGATTKTITTGSTGTFTITGIPLGDYSLSISKGGYSTYSNSLYKVGGTQTGLSFSLPQVVYSVSGTVKLGSSTGPVLPGATVAIVVSGAVKTAVTSSTGTFAITGIPAGTYSLTISKSGYTTYSNTAYNVSANQSSVNFFLTQLLFSLKGTVRSEGITDQVLPGATVVYAGKSAVTDSTGTFSLAGIPAGSYPLFISKSGYITYTNASYRIGGNQTGVGFYLAPQLPYSSVPKTGQTTSYAAGDDGAIQAGSAWPTPRFTDNGDQTINDNLTELVWAKNGNVMASRDPSFDTDGVGGLGAVTWQSALDYVKKLNQERYLGYGDWRLPNRNELASLVDVEAKSGADWLMTQGFSSVQNWYWTSTSRNANAADVIDVVDGSIMTNPKSDGHDYIWPVRNGQGVASSLPVPRTGQTGCWDSSGNAISCVSTGQDGEIQAGIAWPSPRFNDNGNQTVTDNLTGLIWMKNGNTPGPAACGPGVKKDWYAALSFVGCLNYYSYLGYSDWRLPNRSELLTLDNPQYNNQLDWLRQTFTNVVGGYWSSSTTSFDSGLTAWVLWGGGMDRTPKTGAGYVEEVWAVRGGKGGGALSR